MLATTRHTGSSALAVAGDANASTPPSGPAHARARGRSPSRRSCCGADGAGPAGAGRGYCQAAEHHRRGAGGDCQGRLRRRRGAAERLSRQQGHDAGGARGVVVAGPRRAGRQAARQGRELRARNLRPVPRGAEDPADGRRAAAADRHRRRHRGARPRARRARRPRRRRPPAAAGARYLSHDLDPHPHPEEHQPAVARRQAGTDARHRRVPGHGRSGCGGVAEGQAGASCSSGRTGVPTARRCRRCWRRCSRATATRA